MLIGNKAAMQTMCVDIDKEEVIWFDHECRAAGIAYSMQMIDDNTVRCTFSKAFTRDVSRILATPPAEPTRPSLADQISNVERKQRPVHEPTPQKEQVGQIETASPSEQEKRWAAKKAKEELNQGNQEQPSSKPATRKPRASLGRNNQIKARLTDTELVQFRRRVEKSGLPQGDYIREAILNGKIVIEERIFADVAILDELALIRAELGRQGGLLKMIIRPNEGQRELFPGEWDELISAVRGLEAAKTNLSRLEAAILHGDYHA